MENLPIFTSYIVLQQIGLGGMASVYLAEHKTLGHHVAIKVLNKEFTFNQNIRSRFIEEAKKMVRMNHPNVVKVTDLIDEENTVAIVMEYVEGKTLAALSAEHTFSDKEIEHYLKQMLQALSYIHNQGLIHRDIKPSNFILGKDGNLKLTDFGISKSFLNNSEHTQTSTSMSLGTPMYMSPEQVRSTKDVTHLTDIYSLGVVLWQLVSGQKPYNSETTSTFDLQLKIVQEDLPLTHTHWDLIIQKATQKDENKRFQSGEELLMALDKKEVVEDDFERTILVVKRDSKIENKNIVSGKKLIFKKSYLFITIILAIIFISIFSFSNNESHKNLNPYINNLYQNNLKGKVKQLILTPDAIHNKSERVDFDKNNLFRNDIIISHFGDEYTWNFDENGNFTSNNSMDKHRKEYDEFGKLIFSGNQKEYNSTYIYDINNKCVKIINKHKNRIISKEYFRYDKSNKLINWTRYQKEDHSQQFHRSKFCKIAYDSKGRVKFEERRDIPKNKSMLLNYFYDNEGLLYVLKVEEKDNENDRIYTLKYNIQGDITQVSFDFELNFLSEKRRLRYSENFMTCQYFYEYTYDKFNNWIKKKSTSQSVFYYKNGTTSKLDHEEFLIEYREIEYYE